MSQEVTAEQVLSILRENEQTISAMVYLAGQQSLGRRVTVSVEVYDTKGTSKRGHAATFAEAVEQVRAMMEKS